jgi:acetyl-CoA C-acetyltransferase
MNRYLHEACVTREECAEVVVKNRGNALLNPLAAYGAKLCIEDVLASTPTYEPLSELDTSNLADGACVIVLASEIVAREKKAPVWINGIGWCNDTPNVGLRDWGYPRFVRLAAEQAYADAGITDPYDEIDLAEVDDTYSYKELQHLEALRLVDMGEAAGYLCEGAFDLGGELPVNVSGGTLGMGNLLDTNGLVKTFEAVEQLRGIAGQRQVKEAETALVQSWRGVPTTSGVVMVLGNEGGV